MCTNIWITKGGIKGEPLPPGPCTPLFGIQIFIHDFPCIFVIKFTFEKTKRNLKMLWTTALLSHQMVTAQTLQRRKEP